MSWDKLFDYIPNEDVRTVLERLRNCCFSAGGLAIASTTSHIKTANAVNYSIDGQLFTKAATADIDPAGAGTIADGYTNIMLVQLNASGTFSFKLGTAVASGSTPVLPTPDDEVAVIGAVQIQNDSGSTFTIGTTDLDTSNVTDTYYDLSFVLPGETLESL